MSCRSVGGLGACKSAPRRGGGRGADTRARLWPAPGPSPASLAWRPNVLPHTFAHSEEPHAAGSEHDPLFENQQRGRGPGSGGGDAAGPHHARVTVSGRSPAENGLEGRGAQEGRLGAAPGPRPALPEPAACRPPSATWGPPAARGRLQRPGTERGGERGRLPPSLGTRSSCLDLWKTKLIIFHLFLCSERLRRLFFSPLAPSPAPQKRDDFVFQQRFPVEPWPGPRGRCRCCPQGLLQVEEMADFPRLPLGLPPRHSWPGTHARPPPPSRHGQANPQGPAMV